MEGWAPGISWRAGWAARLPPPRAQVPLTPACPRTYTDHSPAQAQVEHWAHPHPLGGRRCRDEGRRMVGTEEREVPLLRVHRESR